LKNLKRITWFAIVLTSELVFLFHNRRIRQEQKQEEHKIILKLLKSNKDIKKLLKIENIEKLGIRFKKHPESKEYNDEILKWTASSDNIIKVPLSNNNKSIIPSNKDKQFIYCAHEIGHTKDKNNKTFKINRACRYSRESCLAEELRADMNVLESARKIGKKIEKNLWIMNLVDLRSQCKKCISLIKDGGCPKSEIVKIKEYLNIIDKTFEIKSKKTIFL